MGDLRKKYGFWTATAMVVGIVIGSGVFFKADDVLIASGGSLGTAMLAWLVGGAIMVSNAYVFARIATRVGRINGLVDYFEEAYGPRAAYFVAWFMACVYYPTLVAVLGWVSAKYALTLAGVDAAPWWLAVALITGFFLLNVLSPVLAGLWQVSATVVKLIPLVGIAVVGTAAGLSSGQSIDSFRVAAESVPGGGGGLAVAVLATAFAYEGWIVATAINAELEDPRRTLPRALVMGTLGVVVVYMTYYLGIAGTLSNEQVLLAGDNAPVQVLGHLFGVGSSLLTAFVVVSCLGTLNGLIMGAARGMYAIACRGVGPAPTLFVRVHQRTDAPLPSAALGYLLSCAWLLVWYGDFAGWWGGFMDISELPIAFLYGVYIALHVWFARTFEGVGPLTRYVAPALATLGSLFIIWGAGQKEMFGTFALVMAAVLALGALFERR